MTKIATTTTPNQGARSAAAYLASRGNKAGVAADLTKIAKMAGARNWQEVNWETLDAMNVQEIVQNVKGPVAVQKRILSVLKGVARSAWRLGGLDTETLVRINDITNEQPELVDII